VPNLLMLARGLGLVAATAALWVQGWRRGDRRFFAGLISIAVTSSLFSIIAWAATAIAPLPLTWVLVGTLARRPSLPSRHRSRFRDDRLGRAK
jgi:hypothetical protein